MHGAVVQRHHDALCSAWAASAKHLSRTLQNLLESGLDVGPSMVTASRRFVTVAVPSPSNWARQQRGTLEQMQALTALENTVPMMEMEFLSLGGRVRVGVGLIGHYKHMSCLMSYDT